MSAHERFLFNIVSLVLFSTLGSILVKCQSCGPNLKTPGYTVPSGDIAIEYGQDLDILCILHNPKCTEYYNSSNDLSIEMADKSQQTEIVNCSTIRLHIEKHPTVSKLLYSCMLKDGGKKKMVCNNLVSVGYKPVEVSPKDFKCRSQNYEKLICTWPKQDTYVHTTYKLEYILTKFSSQRKSCPQADSNGFLVPRDKDTNVSCFWDVSTRPQYMSAHGGYVFALNISNNFGSVVRNYSFEHFKYVIPNAPLGLNGTATSEYSIALSWKLSTTMSTFPPGVHHKIEYLVSKEGGNWSEPIIIKDMLKPPKGENVFRYELTHLKYPHGLYDIRVAMRSALADESDPELWSKTANVIRYTKSKIPDRPPPVNIGSFDIINTPNRSINLYWQQLRELEENGVNFTYHIECVQDPSLRVTTQQGYAKFDEVPDQNLTFRIWSKNEMGRSVKYSTVFVPSSIYTTKVKNPSNLMKEDKNNKQYTLSWEHPNGSNLDNYTIFWCDSNRDRPYMCDGVLNWTVIPKNMTTYTAVIPTEKPYSQFAVSANWRGISSGMSWAECTLIEGTGIGKVNVVYFKKAEPTSITVAWRLECANKQAFITGYEIRYCIVLNHTETENTECKKDEIKSKTIPGNSEIKEATIDHLKPYKTYKVQLKVLVKGNLQSVWSDPIVNHTLEMAPSVPRNLVVTYISNSSVGLSWIKPLEDNGRINRYEIYANNELKFSTTTTQDKELATRTNFNYSISELDSYTTYDIGVKACTTQCSEPARARVTTKKGVPGVVTDVGSRVEKSTLVVFWSPAKKNGKNMRVDYYEIRMSDLDHKNTYADNVTAFNITDNPKYLLERCRDKYDSVLVLIRGVNVEDGVYLAGNWTNETTLPCSPPGGKTLLTIGIVVAVIVFFASMAYLFKRLYDHYNGVKRLDPKLPDSLQAVMNTLEKEKHTEDDDHAKTPDDELPMLKKCPSQPRTLSQGDESSGLSSGNDSTLSSVHSSGGHLSCDSGTEQHSPSLSVGGEKDNISLRQRTSANKPTKKTGYMTVSEMNELGRGKAQPTPGSYSMVGVVPAAQKNEMDSGYVPIDALQPKNPFIQSASPDHIRLNAQGYVPCTPQEPAAKNTDYVMAGIPSREIKPIPTMTQPKPEKTTPFMKPSADALKTLPPIVWPAFSEAPSIPKEGYVCVGDSSPPSKELDASIGGTSSSRGYVPHSKLFEGKSIKED